MSTKFNVIGQNHSEKMKELENEGESFKAYPMATYWAKGARGALNSLYDEFSTLSDRIEKIVGKYWKTGSTWMAICLRTERLLHLLRLKKESK